MKKIILGLILSLSVSLADDKVQGNLTAKEIQAVQTLIIFNGYRCDFVNFALRSSWSGMIDVSCNNNRYSYDIKDVGGRWTVTVD